MKRTFEFVVTWSLRIVLLPLSLVFGWYALKAFVLCLSETAFEDFLSPVVAMSGFYLIMAGWLIYAAVYPAPPWQNKPLKMFCISAGILVGVTAWWFVTCLSAGIIVLKLFGKNPPLEGILLLASFVLVVAIEYGIYHTVRRVILKWKKT